MSQGRITGLGDYDQYDWIRPADYVHPWTRYRLQREEQNRIERENYKLRLEFGHLLIRRIEAYDDKVKLELDDKLNAMRLEAKKREVKLKPPYRHRGFEPSISDVHMRYRLKKARENRNKGRKFHEVSKLIDNLIVEAHFKEWSLEYPKEELEESFKPDLPEEPKAKAATSPKKRPKEKHKSSGRVREMSLRSVWDIPTDIDEPLYTEAPDSMLLDAFRDDAYEEDYG